MTGKGLSWCPLCREQITAYNTAIRADDRTAAQAALDEYIDHRQADPKHRLGGDRKKRVAREGLELCRAVLAVTPKRAWV